MENQQQKKRRNTHDSHNVVFCFINHYLHQIGYGPYFKSFFVSCDFERPTTCSLYNDEKELFH